MGELDGKWRGEAMVLVACLFRFNYAAGFVRRGLFWDGVQKQ